MSRYTLKINGRDAREAFGVIPGTKVLAALMAPPETKEPIVNSSRLSDGVQITVPTGSHRYKERDVNLDVAITASNILVLFARLNGLMGELRKPVVEVIFNRLPFQKFKLCYKGCTQYTQFNGRLAKFVLRFTEPDPTNRT